MLQFTFFHNHSLQDDNWISCRVWEIPWCFCADFWQRVESLWRCIDQQGDNRSSSIPKRVCVLTAMHPILDVLKERRVERVEPTRKRNAATIEPLYSCCAVALSLQYILQPFYSSESAAVQSQLLYIPLRMLDFAMGLWLLYTATPNRADVHVLRSWLNVLYCITLQKWSRSTTTV